MPSSTALVTWRIKELLLFIYHSRQTQLKLNNLLRSWNNERISFSLLLRLFKRQMIFAFCNQQ